MNKSNEPAFPTNEMHRAECGTLGLTKREEFAKAAMQGLLANSFNDGFHEPASVLTPPRMAEAAIGYADAILAELAKEVK